MCNLYSITTNQAAIIALFRVANRFDLAHWPRGYMKARLITGIIFLVLELMHAVFHIARDKGYVPFELHDRLLDMLSYASIVAFIVFVAAAFWHFSYRWFRVIGVVLLFILLPIGMLIIHARLGHFPPETYLLYLVQLIIAGWVYYWSFQRDTDKRSRVALSA
jgi:4-amino-4-deoxy-L-arabinose transferase-like glycosyltransferase